MSLLSRLAVQAARAYGILSAADKTKVVADYLVVAGGGGSGGGGGGAGGYQTSTANLSTLNTYSIAVGAGGSGVVCVGGGTSGIAGSNSSISGTGLSTITSIGGGYGGGGVNGGNGGSGGGAGSSGSLVGGGSGTSGQGNNGGGNGGFTSSPFPAGGGGGAGAVGGTATSTTQAGNGGIGLASSISGSSVYYAGGGGGGYYSTGGTATTGGTGGGGAGNSNTGNAVSGTANTGGGGGGTGPSYLGGSGGSGIVIISYTSATPKFVGGTITTSGGKQIHTFTSSGTLSPITPITASYLVVAGGGGAATNIGGGGGAGGYQASSTTLYSGATYVVTVGAGGSGGASGGDNAGSNGSNSVVSGTGLTTLTSVGGGGGGKNGTPTGAGNGGSGGGAGEGSSYGTGTSGQGNNGGTAYDAGGAYGGGGGGGASAVGANGSSSSGGNGGAGTASSISGTSTTYAGGGGGGGIGTVGSGGAGGGGNANATSGGAGSSGTPNTGGGGGAGGGSYGAGGAGGSGIVIISYAGSQVFNGGLVTSSGGNTIHTFTSTGALTPLTNNLNNSLRFRSSASAYLNRTATVTGNRQTFTWSSWVKRGALGARQHLFVSANPVVNTVGQQEFQIAFASADHLEISGGTSGVGNDISVNTTQLFRDPSAWYHIVVAVDTTQATSANRVKLYVNGNQVTAFQGGITYPSQNYNTSVNLTGFSHRIGGSGTAYLDAYLTDTIEVDGQALEPYYFGNNDANGVWKPIQYKGTYGTNGFYLTFGNTTSTTTLGYDSSPNGNNWTCNNISLTAGTTYDAMTDVPTNTSATVANYAVLNPIAPASISATIADGNLKATGISTGTFESATSTMSFTSGKIYFEATCLSGTGSNASAFIGISNISNATSGACFTNSGSGSIGWDVNGTTLYTIINTTLTSRGAITPTNKVFRVAYDASTGNIWLGYDTTWIGGGDPSTLTTPTGTLSTGIEYICGVTVNTSNDSVAVNFGQRPFAQTIPTGFTSLNTYNLPTPTILQGNKYMDATLYTGTNTPLTVVNQGQFYPDFTWLRIRNQAYGHSLFDSVRGGTKSLQSQTTNAETSQSAGTGINSFNSNGFTLGTDVATNGSTNYNTGTYVAWQWQAGQGSTSSNTSGSITSTVSVNTTAGFSVVTYTGTGSTKTFGHGLGVTPAMFIVKSRSQTGENWVTWHKSFSNTAQGNMALNTTDAVSNSASVWGNTAPTSTLITVGNAAVNNNTSTYVCYAWAEIAGFSKFGSYTGNGSADGVFVYTGFRPKYILIKRTNLTEDWYIYDTSRITYNLGNIFIYADLADAEGTGATGIDILSNGFKQRQTGGGNNASGSTYIYAAFAENPFKNSNAR